MEYIYELVKANPAYFTWIFAVINVLWGLFVYFNKQSHDKVIARLKYDLAIKEAETLPLIKKLQELEELAGEAKEVANSYRSTEQKRAFRSECYPKLERLAGQLSKYPKLTQAIRDLNQFCAIMAEDNPHGTCREEVLNFYGALIKETENVRQAVKT